MSKSEACEYVETVVTPGLIEQLWRETVREVVSGYGSAPVRSGRGGPAAVPDKKAGLSSFPPVEPPPVFYRVRCNCGCTTEEHELRVDERWNLVPTRCMSCGACEQFTLSEEG